MPHLARDHTTTRARGKRLYRVIQEGIVHDLRNGRLQPGDRLGTTRELAAQWNVSPATARQSLEILASAGVVIRIPRWGTAVSDDALKRISATSASVAGMTFAVLVPDVNVPEYAGLTNGLLSHAQRSDIRMLVFGMGVDESEYGTVIHRCISESVSGLVIVPPRLHAMPLSALAELEQSRIPAVTCFRSIDVLGFPVVRSDLFQAVRQATSHLTSTGCSKVGFLEVVDRVAPMNLTIEARHGYEIALASAGRPFRPELIYTLTTDDFYRRSSASTPAERERLRAQICDWLERHSDINGIVCDSDIGAALVIEVARSLGRKIPDDLSVTGIGNLLPYFSQICMHLTTVDLSLAEFGVRSIGLLQRMIAKEVILPGHIEFVTPKVVIGETTRPPFSLNEPTGDRER